MGMRFGPTAGRRSALAVSMSVFAALASPSAPACPIDPMSPVAGKYQHVARHGDEVPCVGGEAAGYPCNNIDLMSFLPLADIGGGSGTDIWGWTDSLTGKEYALMGRSSGTSFIDISDPDAPVYIGNLPTHTVASAWRDIKTMGNFAFIVSEASNHGMQVFNLAQLRDVTNLPVTFSATTHYDAFGSAHNIAVNPQTGFGYATGTQNAADGCNGGLHMIDLSNPGAPAFAGCYGEDGYTHDAQCVIYTGPDSDYNDGVTPREICFAYNEDTLTIVDVTDKSAPSLIARRGYVGSGYTHQGWLTEDQETLLLDDEGDEQANGHNTRTYVWNVKNLDNPSVTMTYDAPVASIDHNIYIKGDFAYEANYQSGLRILDLGDLADGEITENGYFDIYPTGNSASFNGAWSSYPYFDSGVVVVSGIEQGLFVLRPTALGAAFELTASADNLDFCGDGAGSVDIDLVGRPGYVGSVSLSVSGLPAGATAGLSSAVVTPPGTTTLSLNVAGVAPGIYPLTVSGNDGDDEFATTVQMTVSADAPGVPALSAPLAGSTGVSAFQTLFWEAAPGAFRYDVELATDPAFVDVVAEANGIEETSYAPPGGLDVDRQYYWRVRSRNACGGALSPVGSFETAAESCQAFAATDVPYNIANNATVTITSDLEVDAGGVVTDVNVVGLRGLHTYVGDLQMRLEGPVNEGHEDAPSRHPRRTTVTIMDRVCGGDDNFDLNLDDEAAAEIPCPPTGGGTWLPHLPLTDFRGAAGDGVWTLYVNDGFPLDGGRLTGWGLEVCVTPASQGPDLDNDSVPNGQDNCTLVANPDQLDTDGDGFGNRCDGDLNNDNVVNAVDLGLFKNVFLTPDPHADLDGDGIVNVVDLGLFKQLFLQPPGPSGVAN